MGKPYTGHAICGNFDTTKPQARQAVNPPTSTCSAEAVFRLVRTFANSTKHLPTEDSTQRQACLVKDRRGNRWGPPHNIGLAGMKDHFNIVVNPDLRPTRVAEYGWPRQE